MLVDLKRTVAYICPFCSNISTRIISVFNFSGNGKVSLICPTHGCHETCVTITEKNSKYKLSVECPLCGNNHTYTVSKEAFWNKPLLTYKCPAAGIETFFAGERTRIEQALDEYSDIYSDIIDDLDDSIDESPFDLLCIILERLHGLQDRNLISCVCGSSDVNIDVQENNIVMQCRRCERSKKLSVSEDILMRVLNSKAIIIGN